MLPTLIADSIELKGFEKLEDITPYNEGAATGNTVLEIIERFLSNLIGFITILASIFFLVQTFTAAFTWVTAGGDSKKVEQARNQMMQGAIGLIIIVAAYSVLEILGELIGIDILNVQEGLKLIIPK